MVYKRKSMFPAVSCTCVHRTAIKVITRNISTTINSVIVFICKWFQLNKIAIIMEENERKIRTTQQSFVLQFLLSLELNCIYIFCLHEFSIIGSVFFLLFPFLMLWIVALQCIVCAWKVEHIKMNFYLKFMY